MILVYLLMLAIGVSNVLGAVYYPAEYSMSPSAVEEEAAEAADASGYGFRYGVRDSLTGQAFKHAEERQGPKTNGSYQVALPDGRLQVVTYVADQNGYVADVTYEEESRIVPFIFASSTTKPSKTYYPAVVPVAKSTGTLYPRPRHIHPRPSESPEAQTLSPDPLFRSNFTDYRLKLFASGPKQEEPVSFSSTKKSKDLPKTGSETASSSLEQPEETHLGKRTTKLTKNTESGSSTTSAERVADVVSEKNEPQKLADDISEPREVALDDSDSQVVDLFAKEADSATAEVAEVGEVALIASETGKTSTDVKEVAEISTGAEELAVQDDTTNERGIDTTETLIADTSEASFDSMDDMEVVVIASMLEMEGTSRLFDTKSEVSVATESTVTSDTQKEVPENATEESLPAKEYPPSRYQKPGPVYYPQLHNYLLPYYRATYSVLPYVPYRSSFYSGYTQYPKPNYYGPYNRYQERYRPYPYQYQRAPSAYQSPVYYPTRYH